MSERDRDHLTRDENFNKLICNYANYQGELMAD